MVTITLSEQWMEPPVDGRTDFDQTCIDVSSKLVYSAIGYLAHIIRNKTNILSKAKQQTKKNHFQVN